MTVYDPEEAFELNLLRALATALSEAQGPRQAVVWHQDPTVPYADADIGIYVDEWPEIKGGSVTIADYSVSDAGTLSDSVIGVQFTIRNRNRAVVKRIVSDLFDLFHGLPRCTMGGITVVTASRTSGTSIGQDSNNRQGRTENYYFSVHRPSPHRQ